MGFARYAALAALSVQIAHAASFKVDVCASGSYFDTSSLTCLTCGAASSGRVSNNATIDVYGSARSCTCGKGYYETIAVCDSGNRLGCSAPTCSACPANQGPAKTAVGCLPCGNGTTGYDPAYKDCGCPAPTWNTSYYLVETGPDGQPLGYKTCAVCPAGTRSFWSGTGARRSDPYTCQSCGDANSVLQSDGTCACARGYRQAGLDSMQARGSITCIPDTESRVLATYTETAAKLASFYSVQNSANGPSTGAVTNLASRYYEHLYAAAAVRCRTYRPGTDTSACHALANLCVLAMYSKRHTACQLYLDTKTGRAAAVNGFAGWPSYLPQLYWDGDFRSITADSSLAQDMAFKRGTAKNTALRLEFYLAAYSLNGTFLGVQPLRNQLAYCGGGGDRLTDEPPWLDYGYSTSATYGCDVRALARSGEPVLYDLYVRDLAADGVASSSSSQRAGLTVTAAAAAGMADLPLRLYPVPVRMVNYRDDTGSQPNANTARADEANDVLTGRFFLVDAVSGVTTVGQLPEVVRYAARITLTVRTQSTTTGLAGSVSQARISPPVLTIEYRERPTAAVFGSANAPVPAMARDSMSFAVEYEGEYTGYSNSILALGASLGVLVALWACVKVAAWIRMNARTQFEATISGQHVALWVLFLVSACASAFLWYLWAVCAYWLVYFKLQDSVYSLVPVHRPGNSDDPYASFRAGLVIVFVAYCIRLGHLLYQQVTVDVFMLDWEKPRGSLMRSGQEADMANAGAVGTKDTQPHRLTPISVWRTIFAANEWCELSVERRTSLPLTLFILVLLLEGAKLKYIATPQPDVRDLSPGPINPALQFANTLFWYFIIWACQMTWQTLLGERYLKENPSLRFLDMCTVQKVSLLLMDGRYRGWYLHCNAPHEYADGDMSEVAGHLAEEGAAIRTGRGLPGCPDPMCQTFEVHVPALWRATYDRVFRRLLDSESAAVEAGLLAAQQGVQGMGGQAGGAGYGASAPGYGTGALAPLSSALGSSSSSIGLLRWKARSIRLASAWSTLSTFLRGFITESDPDYKRVWREHTLLQAAFDFPPDMVNDGMGMGGGAGAGGVPDSGAAGMQGGAGAAGGAGPGSATSRVTYMYCDPGFKWERLIYRGIEWDLAAWDGLLFCLVDWALGSNPTAAAVATYVLSMAVKEARHYLGVRNVAYKTLVDGRFLE